MNYLFKSKTVILLLAVLLFFSCQKEEKLNNSETNSKIKINSLVIQEFVEHIDLNNSTVNKAVNGYSSKNKFNPNKSDSINLKDNYTEQKMIHTPELDALVETQIPTIAFKNKLNKVAIDVPISNEIKFRLIIYNQNNLNTPLYNKSLSLDEDPMIDLVSGITYRWYAFSTNESTVPDIDATGVINSSQLTNKDFMFATNTINPNRGDNYLNITFKRQMHRIQVTLNTRGIFGSIENSTSISLGSGAHTNTTFNTLIQTGDFSIINENFTSLAPATTNNSISAANMSIADPRWSNTEKIANFYTAVNTNRTIAMSTLKLRLNTLNITLDDASTRSYAANTLIPIPHSQSLNIQKGKSSKTTVRLIESGVLVNGLYWARTNLIYDASKLNAADYTNGVSDAYRFAPHHNYINPDPINEYWNQGSATPNGTTYNAVDVCSRVYPQGTWQKPSGIEIESLIATNSHTGRRDDIGGGVYKYSLVWSRDPNQPVNSAYPINNLILPFYGYRNATGAVTGRPNGSATASGRMNYSARNYESSNGAGHSLFASFTNGSMVKANITIEETTLPNTNGQTIRCVRKP